MSYKPAKWPTYANDGLEDALSLLEDIRKEVKKAQAATKNGDRLEAVIIMSEIGDKAVMAHSTLIQAKAGEYRRQGSCGGR